MARPTKFSPTVAARLLDVIASGCGRELAARMAGISLRTLVNWIAKGRSGDPAFATFAEQVDDAERKFRTARIAMSWLREAERRRVHYREVYKPRRIAWWRDKLGEEAFWRARLHWLRDHGRHAAADRLEARLLAEGYGCDQSR